MARSPAASGMVALLMTACSATGTGADRGAAAGVAWNACGDGLVCATVAVPLDWSMPSGPTITLAFAKHPADSGAPTWARCSSTPAVPVSRGWMRSGTFLGETYANMFPTRVRAMVLDGIIDPASYVSSAWLTP